MARPSDIVSLWGNQFQLPPGWTMEKDLASSRLMLRCHACGGGGALEYEMINAARDPMIATNMIRHTVEKHEHECGKVMRQQAIQAREKGMPVYYNTNTWGGYTTSGATTTGYYGNQPYYPPKYEPVAEAPKKPKTAVERLKASVDQIRVPIPV